MGFKETGTARYTHHKINQSILQKRMGIYIYMYIHYNINIYNINQKDEGTQDDRGRDGGITFILRTKEQETHLALQEHDDTHTHTHTHTHIYIYTYIYRVSQEECARLRVCVPYVKVYRYNPKHLCPKLNGYGDNGQRRLKF